MLLLVTLASCNQDQAAVSTVADTSPPTILGTSVQGGPIPVNAPILLTFNEKINLTSAQRGITLQSSIDAQPITGRITLQLKGREVKYTPTGQMTPGPYVLTVLGVKDTKGNVLTTPFSIFFQAIDSGSIKNPTDVTPPTVVSTTPITDQIVQTTSLLVIRFSEVVDPASAQSGISVPKVKDRIITVGAVVIFEPREPMPIGQQTLEISGVKDLVGNAISDRHQISFQVTIIPPAEEELTEEEASLTVVPSRGGIFWEAEKFVRKKGDSIGSYKVPFKARGNPDQGVKDYVIKNSSAGRFIGVDNGRAVNGSWLKYRFTVPRAGKWYFWGRVIAPSVADNSFFWGVDIGDHEAKNEDDNNCNIWDFFEKEELRQHYTTDWVWFRLNSRNGNPFPGQEMEQHGANPTPLELKTGQHTFHLIDRENGTFIDAIYATMNKRLDVNKLGPTGPLAVEMEPRLSVLWGQLKSSKSR